MSKRYVIQVYVINEDNATLNAWETVQHPNGGDWVTRARSTAIADAARFVQAGETRELRVALSQPVYTLTSEVEHNDIVEASKSIYNPYATGESDVDQDLTGKLEAQVGEVPDTGDDDDDDDDDDPSKSIYNPYLAESEI